MFLMVKTRPDIAFFIGITTYFVKNLSNTHTKTVKTDFYYFQRSINQKLIEEISICLLRSVWILTRLETKKAEN